MSKPSYHFVGIGGVGMSALASLLALRGYAVSGSDRANDKGKEGLEIFTKLQKIGVKLFPQDGSGITQNTAYLVISSAIEPDNADIKKAKELNIPIKHRTDILKELTVGKTLIGITGTAGKTTLTGMIGWILESVGFSPTVVNGGEVINWITDDSIGSTRNGSDKLWVLELDESDKTLLKFSPDWAVITNITKDHFELDELHRIFDVFSKQVKQGVITSKDIPQNYQAALERHGVSFSFSGTTCSLKLLGRHNIENALFALILCEKIGVSIKDAAKALSEFKGIKRRLEIIGEKNDVTIIDDYAHNPAKIVASIKAIKPLFERVNAVWRPHGFAPLRLMLNELAIAFSENLEKTDSLFLLPPYYAGGSVVKDISSYDLKTALIKKGAEFPIKVVEDYTELQRELINNVKKKDVILLMGARDPVLPLFAKELFNLL